MQGGNPHECCTAHPGPGRGSKCPHVLGSGDIWLISDTGAAYRGLVALAVQGHLFREFAFLASHPPQTQFPVIIFEHPFTALSGSAEDLGYPVDSLTHDGEHYCYRFFAAAESNGEGTNFFKRAWNTPKLQNGAGEQAHAQGNQPRDRIALESTLTTPQRSNRLPTGVT